MAIKRWNASTSQWELVGTPGTATPSAIGAASIVSNNTFAGTQTIQGSLNLTGNSTNKVNVSSKFTVDTSNAWGAISLARQTGQIDVMKIQGADSTGASNALRISNDSGNSSAIDIYHDSLRFYVNSSTTERMRIDANGNMNLGGSSAVDALRYLDIQNTNSGNSAGTIIRFITNNAANSAVTTVDMVKYRNGTFVISNNDTGATAIFQFNNAGAERMRIDGNGSLLVGYTGTNSASYKLQVNSQIFATSSSIATSDGRYKENVLPITSGLDIIDSLNPVSFNWKEHPVHNFVEGKTVGFIAQEVQEALSEYDWADNIIKTNMTGAVLDEEGNEVTPAEEFLGIAESNIIPLLVAAVKELRAEVNTLKAQLSN